jgi:hypothetical protein
MWGKLSRPVRKGNNREHDMICPRAHVKVGEDHMLQNPSNKIVLRMPDLRDSKVLEADLS